MVPQTPHNNRVALVAAARNEAAYLPEWVFHHHYFGFGPIEIHVNRSNDGSQQLVKHIATFTPGVELHSVGTGGRNPNPQRAAYDNARRRLRRAAGPHDYTMFLDIDEFWTPTDLQSSILDVMSAAHWPAVAAFNWLQLTSDTKAFEPAIAAALIGEPHQHVKSAFRSRLRILGFTPHGVRPLPHRRIWSANQTELTWRRPFMSKSPPKQLDPAFILHRFFRSQMEYLAILGRGRPRTDAEALKQNRPGYHVGVLRDQDQLTFSPPDAARQRYETARRAFFAKLGDPQRQAAQTSVKQRAAHVLKTYLAMSPEEKQQWRTQFQNLDLDALCAEIL